MDFLSRLLGASYTPRKPAPKPVNDASSRLSRYNRVLASITQLCNNQRDLSREVTTLNELQILFDRLTQVIRDESRAAQPHPCVQHTASQQVYALVNRAASISFHKGCIHSAVALMSALVDSEEESFLTNRGFAKSLTRLVTRVIDNEEIDLPTETESLILELLFTIAAKIRLQPEILPSWFTLTRRAEIFDDEKGTSFGFTRAQDFPLCVILVDRIYKEGRTGDFARTALLYLFEATTKSSDLAVYMVESSICTLMASGLGALYSQLSRELSILHPDALLPPVLAMSDYTTRQLQTAESAFNETHVAHMSTFISYMFFWVDILDHVKRADVKQALLDNFEILFLQQLLYPSILQSSDIDAGSATAILTYIEAIVSGIEHPALIDVILSYILAIDRKNIEPEEEDEPVLQRRESLLAMTQSGNMEDLVEPQLFTLADLIANSLNSANSQAVFSALRLSATIIRRQSKYAIGTILKATPPTSRMPIRTIGAVEIELHHYMQLASRIQQGGVHATLSSLIDDRRLQIEASSREAQTSAQRSVLAAEGGSMPKLFALLRSFFTNPIEVNLALTDALIAVASLPQILLDGWLALNSNEPVTSAQNARRQRHWQQHVDEDDRAAFEELSHACARLSWPDSSPHLFKILSQLVEEYEAFRSSVPDIEALLKARRVMLQLPGLDETPSLPVTPMAVRRSSYLRQTPTHEGTPSRSRDKTSGRPGEDTTFRQPSPAAEQPVVTSPLLRTSDADDANSSPLTHRIFQPPPVEQPSTTDVLMRQIEFDSIAGIGSRRAVSLNHALTNTIILQEFILEIAAVIQVRASLFSDVEILTH